MQAEMEQLAIEFGYPAKVGTEMFEAITVERVQEYDQPDFFIWGASLQCCYGNSSTGKRLVDLYTECLKIEKKFQHEQIKVNFVKQLSQLKFW